MSNKYNDPEWIAEKMYGESQVRTYKFTISEDNITVRNECYHCREENNIIVDAKSYAAWKAGELIQVAFMGLSRQQCEMIKTGIHPECWEEIFGE